MTSGSGVGRDLVGYLTGYPQEVAFGDEEAADVFDRYHVPAFEMFNDGVRLDRDQLIAHMRPARKNATSVHVDVHEALTTGDRVAASYTLTAVLRKGRTVTTEIYMFGHLAGDGRLRRVDQITRNVPTESQ
ncbi:nuclear transport factor 2 family protein [Acrocarpospora macrocephala]|nr:nuclear transport factor 2 family protein [Acrocarpospora macrocephala]